MINKLISIIFLSVVILHATLVYANEIKIPDISKDELNFKNPFESLLPDNKESETGIPIQKPDTITDIVRSDQIPREVVVSLPDIVISGIVWNTSRPQAIINDMVVDKGDAISIDKTGDEVSKIKIIDIRKNELDLIYKEKLFVVDVQKHGKKSPKNTSNRFIDIR